VSSCLRPIDLPRPRWRFPGRGLYQPASLPQSTRHEVSINQHPTDRPVRPSGNDPHRITSLSVNYRRLAHRGQFSSASNSCSASERDFLLPRPLRQFQPPPPPVVKMAATKVGHILAKGLGIKLNYRDELNHEIRRGESVFSTSTADTYVEEEPTSVEWIRDTLPAMTWSSILVLCFHSQLGSVPTTFNG
jgi:hypothetical protein